MDGIWVTAVTALSVAVLGLLGVIFNAVYARLTSLTNANLQRETEKEILELKTTINRTVDLYTAASASFAEGQKAAMERKLDAIDKLWDKILMLRKSQPPIMPFIDIMTVEEYKDAKDNPNFKPLREGLSEGLSKEKLDNIFDSGEGPIEKVRPYVGEWMWALFYCYRTVIVRLSVLFQLERDDTAEMEEWFKDEGIRQLVKTVLNSDEFREFDQLPFGKWSNFQRRIDSKLLAASKRVISGKEFGTDTVEQAWLIQKAADELQQQDKSNTL